VTSVYSVGYVRGHDEAHQTRYFAAFAASIAATIGVAFSANLLTLFVFYELLTVATYPLVVHAGTAEARAAGREYLAYTLGGGAAIFAGLLLVQVVAGSVAFVPGGLDGLAADPLLSRAAFGLLAVGFAVKTAVMPLHGWLPTAMVAPTPVSGLLHAVAVVKSGAFGLGRVVMYTFGPETVTDLGVGRPLAYAAAATMVLAGLVALRQRRLKRALAYSTISQLSYIALGFALVQPLAAFGALLHVVAHAFMKITLFFCAGLLYVESHVTTVDELPGVARRHPATLVAFAVGAAGLAGFPFVAGFVSKWYLVLGSLEADALVLAAAFLVAGALKLLLFWPMLASAFFGRGDPAPSRAPRAADGGYAAAGQEEWAARGPLTESSGALLGPILVVAAGAVVLGVVPDWFPTWDLAWAVVAEVFR
jgi:NADH-quinone oxidoreductase subunit L/multicomponent Na+:H+ antiporter subunit D